MKYCFINRFTEVIPFILTNQFHSFLKSQFLTMIRYFHIAGVCIVARNILFDNNLKMNKKKIRSACAFTNFFEVRGSWRKFRNQIFVCIETLLYRR